MRDFTFDLVWTKIQFAVTVLGGRVNCFIGGVDGFITTLIILMALDCVTGIMCAIVDKKLSSSIFLKGIFKKMLIIMLVGVAHIIDINVVGAHEALRSVVICFYLSNEGVSVLRNASKLGLPVPEKLKTVFSKLNDKTMILEGDNTTDHGDGE